MAANWQPLALVPRARFEKKFGTVAELLRRRALEESALASTWLLEKKALRRALEFAVPPGHLPVEIAAEPNPDLLRQKAARAYCRLRDAKQLVPGFSAPPTGVGEGRFFVWSSPAPKPGTLELPQLSRLVEAGFEDLADAVAELWSAVYFESVLGASVGKASRIEVAIGVTRASEAARRSFDELFARAYGAEPGLLPLPGRAYCRAPFVELDRSLAERSVRSVLAELACVVKVPRGLFVVGGGRAGVDPSLLAAIEGTSLVRSQREALDESLGVGALDSPSSGTELRRLGSWVETLLEDRASERQLEREIEGEEEELAARFSWLREMDLAILPADGLRRTIEELLAPIDRVAGLSFRATHAAAFVCRLHGALGSFEASTIDAGLDLAPLRFLCALTCARERIDAGEPNAKVAFDLWLDHPEYFPGALGKDPFALPEQPPSDVLDLLGAEPRFDVDELREGARVVSDRAIARAEARAPRFVAALAAPLRSRARRMVELRERARAVEVRLDYLLRRVLFDAGRRLPRFELDLDEGAVWHARVSEIIEAVDLRGHGLRDRVRWRRAEVRLSAAQRGLAQGVPPSPLGLAHARRLHLLVHLLGASGEVRYEGRPSDTVPSVLCALGRPVSCFVGPP